VEGGEVEAAGGFAAGNEDDGAFFVSELDGPSPSFVSNVGPVSSPSRISTDRFFASSKATSRETSKTQPRF
jgi:hypothetical protein